MTTVVAPFSPSSSSSSMSSRPSSAMSSASDGKPLPRPGLTCALGFTLWSASISSFLAYDAGGIGLARHVVTTVPFLYFLCICIHDGVHGVLLPSRRLGNAAAYVLSLVIALPFPLLQRAHLRHHGRLGRDDDPEAVVYRARLLPLLLRLPFIPFFYLRSLKGMRPVEVALSVVHLGLVATVFAALKDNGHGVVAGWLLPALVAIVWFGFTTVWVPHNENAAWWMRFGNAHSGWHDDHHRDPRFPFHQYATIRARHLDDDHGGRGRDVDRVVFFWAKKLW